MGYKCKKCGKRFKLKSFLEKHMLEEIPCDKKYVCPHCARYFRDQGNLTRHLNRKIPCVTDDIPIITDDNKENRCQYCNKTFAAKSSLVRHQKICDKPANLAVIMAKLEQMQTTMAQMQLQSNNLPVAINVTNNNSQNMYVGNNLCIFGEEDYTLLDQTKIKNLLLDEPKEFVSGLIRELHANPDLPQYHNVFYERKTEKAMVFTRTMVNGIMVSTWQLKEFSEVSKILVYKAKRYPTCMPLAQDIKPNSIDEQRYCRSLEIITREYEHSDKDLINNKKILSMVTENPAFHKMVDNTTYISYTTNV
jgi:DNA-directed RNA polymerase subunit RPC12/RpoP